LLFCIHFVYFNCVFILCVHILYSCCYNNNNKNEVTIYSYIIFTQVEVNCYCVLQNRKQYDTIVSKKRKPLIHIPAVQELNLSMLPMVVAEIRRLSQDEGLKDGEIAAILGTSRATVNRARQKHGIPPANLRNRKDKECFCVKCNQAFFIRRHERKRHVCEMCSNVTKNEK
jgi:DNA-binding transcriptional regulator YiaG